MPTIFPWPWLRRNALREREQLAQDYRIVFGSDAGQRVLADILRREGVMADAFHPDPATHAYAAGRRRAALEIVQALNLDEAAIRAMATTGDTEEMFR